MMRGLEGAPYNMKLSIRSLLITGCLAALSSPVLADDNDGTVPPVSDAPEGQDTVTRGVQSPDGLLSLKVTLAMNLSSDLIGQPLSIAPNLYYGINDRFQVGLIHDGPMRQQTRPGAGLCLTGSDNGCANVYDNVGLDAMYGVVFGPALHLSGHGSLYVTSFDAGTVMLAVGVTGKIHLTNTAAVFFDPQIGVQLAKRDTVDDMLFLPVEFQYQVGLPTTIKLLTGVTGSLSTLGDTYEVPVGIGFNRNLDATFDIGARFSFDNMLGKQAEGSGRADARSLAVLLNVRL